MAGLHIMDIQVTCPSADSEMMRRFGCSVRAGCEHTGGKARGVYWVVGEPRIVAVLEGGISGAFDSAQGYLPGKAPVSIKCEPLRSYTGFSQKDLGVPADLAEAAEMAAAGYKTHDPDNRFFWMSAALEHRGVTQEAFQAVWREEAEAVCRVMASDSDLVTNIYKVIGARHLHAFFSTPDPDSLDGLFWKLPIHSAMGDQIHRTFRSLQPCVDKGSRARLG